MSYPTWDEWFDGLPEPQRREALRLREVFDQLGAKGPAEWARSEVSEGFPQLARFLILRRLWSLAIDGWSAETIARLPAARRLLDAGGDGADVVRIMRAAAYEATFAVLYHVAYGSDDEAPDGLSGWQLMELDGNGDHTGRAIDGLYEDLLTMDPSGRDGADLWE